MKSLKKLLEIVPAAKLVKVRAHENKHQVVRIEGIGVEMPWRRSIGRAIGDAIAAIKSGQNTLKISKGHSDTF